MKISVSFPLLGLWYKSLMTDNCTDCGARRAEKGSCKKGWRRSYHKWDQPIYEAEQRWSFEGRNSGNAFKLWFKFCVSLISHFLRRITDGGRKNPHIILSILQFSTSPPPRRLVQVVLSFAFRYIFFLSYSQGCSPSSGLIFGSWK